MDLTFTLSDEEYNQLIQMLINANPIIRKLATQAQAQMAKPKEVKPNGPDRVEKR